MKLITKEIEQKLTKAGYNNTKPICKLFCPWGAGTWLLTSMDSDGILSGWADLGFGVVEHGGIATVEELEAIKGPANLGIERDLYWTPPTEDIDYCKLDSLMGV